MRVLCEVTKLGSAEQVQRLKDRLLQVAQILERNDSLMGNTVIRKLRTKLVARIAIRLLPGKIRRLHAKGQSNIRVIRASPVPSHPCAGRTLDGTSALQADGDDEDFEAPEEVEVVLEDLLKSLRDKDTIVRYSAAKGVARVSERLPAEFADQVLEQVLQLFSIHSIAVASLYDMPSVAEGTWHGACLACAEMARRSLIPDERLGELVGWLNKVSAIWFSIVPLSK